jgi:hypothetical protein
MVNWRKWLLPSPCPVYPDVVAKVESCIGSEFLVNLKREAIDDSRNLSRDAEVAYEFSVRP